MPEARHLVADDYGHVFAGISANPAETIASQGKIVRYRNDYTAVVDTPTGYEVESSTAPLRVKDASGRKLPVSLELVPRDGAIRPRRPLHPVAIGARADEGVSLTAAGVSMTVMGKNSSAALIEDKEAFYGEIAADTDVVATPKLDGADLSAVLRSVDSPEALRYRVGLPLGAKLVGDDGAATIRRGGTTIARIPAPWARDAQGTQVPTVMRVQGDELVVEVAHREGSYAYPILVDPELLEEISASSEAWTYSSGGSPGPRSFDDIFDESLGSFSHSGPGSGSPLELTNNTAKELPFEDSGHLGPGEETLEVSEYVSEFQWTPDPDNFISAIYIDGISTSGAAGTVDTYSRFVIEACGQTKVFHTAEVHPTNLAFTPLEAVNNCNSWWIAGSSLMPSPVQILVGTGIKQDYSEELGYLPKGEHRSVGPATVSVAAVVVARPLSWEEEIELDLLSSETYGSSNPSQLSNTTCLGGDPVNCATGNLVETEHDLSVAGLGPDLSVARTYNSQLAATQDGSGPFGAGWAEAFEGGVEEAEKCLSNCEVIASIALAEGEEGEGGEGEEGGEGVAGLVAAYALDEGEGETALDSAGEHDGAVSGAEWAPGKFGPSLRFGANPTDRVTVPSSTGLELTEAFTLEAWVRPGKAEGFVPVIEKETPGFFGYELGIQGSGVPAGYISPEGSGEEYVSATKPLPRHEWSHLALTFDGTHLRLYVDGELAGTAAVALPQGGAGALQIGGSEIFGNTFVGKIDEVRIYDHALTAEEIQTDETTPIGTTEGSEGPEEEPEEPEEEEPEDEPEVREERTTIQQYNGSTAEFRRVQGETAWLPVDPRNRAELVSEGEGFVYTLPDQTVQHLDSSGQIMSEEDADGNTVTVSRNAEGQVESVSDEAGRELVYSYNAAGFVKSVEDPMGHVVHYGYEDGDLISVSQVDSMEPKWELSYDHNHELTSVTNANGGVTRTRYESLRAVEQEDPMGRVTRWDYSPDEEGSTTTITEPNGSETVEQFDQEGLVSSVTRGAGTPLATTTSYEYNPADELTAVIDAEERRTEFGYDLNGNKISETNPIGEERTWTYDGAHRVTSETSPSGEKTTISRDANGNPQTISRPAPGKKDQTTSFEYGSHGELESVTDAMGATWTYGYDGHGDKTSETDPEGDERTWSYDGDSRVVSLVSPRGNEPGAEPAEFTTSIERDAQGRPIKVTDPLGGSTEYAYDSLGDVESTTDPNGHQARFVYDADREQTKVERPDGAVEETGYDAAGQVISQTNGNEGETTYVRNALEQPVEIIDPLERATSFSFDAAGDLESETDAEARTTTYSYDEVGRLDELSYSAEPGQDVVFAYDVGGLPVGMTDGTGESTYEYDQLGRLVRSENGSGEAVGWQYNLDNEPVGLTYPNGHSISRGYDEAGRLASVTDWLGNTTAFSYSPDSELVATDFPASTGDTDGYSYDRDDRMAAVTMRKDEEALASLAYSRDPAGQVEASVSNGFPGSAEESFGYDEGERLIEAGADIYEYDSANNMVGAPGTTNVFDKAGELESATGIKFTYDAEGERTAKAPSSGPPTTYGYDQAGELTAVERPEEGESAAIAESLSYDGNGLLASRTTESGTEHLVWDQSTPLALLLADGGESYIYGPGGLPVEQVSAEEPEYLHHDQLGSTRMLTGESGGAVATFSYDPYGSLSGTTGSASSAVGYAGQYTLGESGLQFLRARTYDPSTGQFLTKDPLASTTLAPYSYAQDNPVNGIDPTGMCNANPFSGSFWTQGNCLSESALNPIPYYEREVEAWESGCSYWSSVLNGVQGAAVATSDVAAVGGLAEGAGLLEGSSSEAGAGASAVVGRRGSPIAIEAGTNVATEIGGIEYSGHALDMMQSDGITPSVVKNAITQGIAGVGRDGAILYYDSANNITAVVSSSGRVITVYPGGS